MATRSAWTRPGFLAAGIFLALVAVLATITALHRHNGHTSRNLAAGTAPGMVTAPPSATAPGCTPNAATPNGTTPNGTTPNAATPNGTTPEGNAPRGNTPTGSGPTPAPTAASNTGAQAAAPHDGTQTAPTAAPHDSTQTAPTAAPTDVSWTLYKGVAVPMSKADGPLLVSGDVARCYADAPLGAVIAAWQFVTRAVCGDDWRSVVAQEAVAGPDANAFIAAHQSGKVQCDDASGGHVQLAGFSVVGYSPQLAVVQLAERSPENALAAMSVTMQWQDGDWKVAFQPGGAMAAGWHSIDNLDGLIPWTGV